MRVHLLHRCDQLTDFNFAIQLDSGVVSRRAILKARAGVKGGMKMVLRQIW